MLCFQFVYTGQWGAERNLFTVVSGRDVHSRSYLYNTCGENVCFCCLLVGETNKGRQMAGNWALDAGIWGNARIYGNKIGLLHSRYRYTAPVRSRVLPTRLTGNGRNNRYSTFLSSFCLSVTVERLFNIPSSLPIAEYHQALQILIDSVITEHVGESSSFTTRRTHDPYRVHACSFLFYSSSLLETELNSLRPMFHCYRW